MNGCTRAQAMRMSNAPDHQQLLACHDVRGQACRCNEEYHMYITMYSQNIRTVCATSHEGCAKMASDYLQLDYGTRHAVRLPVEAVPMGRNQASGKRTVWWLALLLTCCAKGVEKKLLRVAIGVETSRCAHKNRSVPGIHDGLM